MTRAQQNTFRDCYRKTQSVEDWNAEEQFDKKRARYELFQTYKATQEENRGGDWENYPMKCADQTGKNSYHKSQQVT